MPHYSSFIWLILPQIPRALDWLRIDPVGGEASTIRSTYARPVTIFLSCKISSNFSSIPRGKLLKPTAMVTHGLLAPRRACSALVLIGELDFPWTLPAFPLVYSAAYVFQICQGQIRI
jgi:hypothetical protein